MYETRIIPNDGGHYLAVQARVRSLELEDWKDAEARAENVYLEWYLDVYLVRQNHGVVGYDKERLAIMGYACKVQPNLSPPTLDGAVFFANLDARSGEARIVTTVVALHSPYVTSLRLGSIFWCCDDLVDAIAQL